MEKKHSLFIKKIKDKNIYTLFLGNLTGEDREIHDIVYKLRQAKSQDILVIRINSRGGSVADMLAIFNAIYDKFFGRVVTYIEEGAYSAGATIFMCGKQRIVYPYSIILFHVTTQSVEGTIQKIEAKMRTEKKAWERRASEIFVPYLSKNELEKMYSGEQYYFESEEMCKRKIATHVMVKGKKLTAQAYLKSLENK